MRCGGSYIRTCFPLTDTPCQDSDLLNKEENLPLFADGGWAGVRWRVRSGEHAGPSFPRMRFSQGIPFSQQRSRGESATSPCVPFESIVTFHPLLKQHDGLDFYVQ